MATTPLKDQVVKVDFMQSIEWMLEAGERVSNQYLARAVEASTGRPLPPKLRHQVGLVLSAAPEKTRRGRKETSPALLLDLMTHVERLYNQLCDRYSKQDQREDAEKMPRRTLKAPRLPVSERAYRETQRRMSKYFPNREWTVIRNEHSMWRKTMREWSPPETGNEHPDD